MPVPAGPMPKMIVCLSIDSTYRFWFSVLGRIVRPRLDRMLRLSTSAGRSLVSVRSIADRALDRLGGDALAGADDRDQLVEEPLDQRHLGGLAAQGDLVAADVDVGVEGLLDEGEVLVAGAEQRHHVDAVGHHDGVGRHSIPVGRHDMYCAICPASSCALLSTQSCVPTYTGPNCDTQPS